MNEKLTQSLDEFVERQHGVAARQYLPRERTDVSYVSRLQCVQAAVTSQIESLTKEHPNKRVAIVTFSNDVTVHLPGGVHHVITGDKLGDFAYLLDATNHLQIKVDQTVEVVAKELNSMILGLEESGATALGPALLTSIGIAGQAKGSTVVLCTDGIANIGLGSLEDDPGDNPNSVASLFYKQVSEVALQKGVSVSVISIKGTNASMEHIAKVSADTRGYNDIVDPLNLTKNFNFVLQNNIIATDVSATMFLNKGLTFRHEKNAQNTKATRIIGNCTKESTITFEYYPAGKEQVQDLKFVHFQVQINYTKLDGTKCMRIISKMAEVTHKREEAEKHVNVNIVGLHSQAQAAQLATEGQYTKARMVQKTNMRMVRRTLANAEATESQASHYGLWNKEAVRLNSAIKSTKISEKKVGVHYDSAEEDGSDEEVERERDRARDRERDRELDRETDRERRRHVRKEQKSKIELERKQRRTKNDAVSNVLYQACNPLFSAYTYNSNPLYEQEKEEMIEIKEEKEKEVKEVKEKEEDKEEEKEEKEEKKEKET